MGDCSCCAEWLRLYGGGARSIVAPRAWGWPGVVIRLGTVGVEMHDDDTLEDVEELLKEVRERRLRGQEPSGGDAAGGELAGLAGLGDDETIVVGPQDVAESGAGWVLSDDEETIDVDPELLRKLRSSPTVSDVDETIVADVSRLGASRPPESAPGSPEAGSHPSGSSLRRLVPMWARVAVGLVAAAVLVAAASIAGWEPFSGDATTDSASGPVAAPEREGKTPQEAPTTAPEEATTKDPVPEPEMSLAEDSVPDEMSLAEDSVPDEMSLAEEGPVAEELAALPGEGVDIIAGRAVWSDGYFQAEVYKQLLEELGYNVSDPADVELGPETGYTAMAQGEMDFWPNSWYPDHLVWLAGFMPDGSRVGDHVTIVGEEMIAGGKQGFLVTKSFADEYGVYTMDELNRNADALAAFDATDFVPGNGVADIFGCPEYWTCDNLIENQIAFGGWDNIVQTNANYDAVFAQAVANVNEDVPMVLYAFTPSEYIVKLRPGDNVYWLGVDDILDDSNPANKDGGEKHDQRGADGSGGYAAIGPDRCPAAADNPDGLCPIGWVASDILVTANNDFLAANPAAQALFEAGTLSMIDVSLAYMAMDEGENPTDLATQWIADNRDRVDEWIHAALAAE